MINSTLKKNRIQMTGNGSTGLSLLFPQKKWKQCILPYWLLTSIEETL